MKKYKYVVVRRNEQAPDGAIAEKVYHDCTPGQAIAWFNRLYIAFDLIFESAYCVYADDIDPVAGGLYNENPRLRSGWSIPEFTKNNY